MEDVPAKYLLWLYDEMRKRGDYQKNSASRAVFEYIEKSHAALTMEESDYIPKFKPSDYR